MRIFPFNKSKRVRVMRSHDMEVLPPIERIRPMDPFESYGPVRDQNIRFQNDPVRSSGNLFPDFNSQWTSPVDEGIKTKLGGGIEKGTDIAKKAAYFYVYGVLLVTLLILLPTIFRFVYEFASWTYSHVGNIFH